MSQLIFIITNEFKIQVSFLVHHQSYYSIIQRNFQKKFAIVAIAIEIDLKPKLD